MTGDVLAQEQHMRLKRCRHGLFMYNALDKYVGGSLDHYGEFSEGEVELFRQFVRSGMVALDIGANIGTHTVALAKMVQPGGCVIAFEPQRVVHQLLSGNIALNALDNVATLRMALGKQNGEILVPPQDYSKWNNFGGVELKTSGTGEVVTLQTLDAFRPPDCHFIKIDVEGMEQEVLEGAREYIDRCKPILYVENDRRPKAEALVAYLHGIGYRTFWHPTKLFNPNNFFGATDDLFPNIFSLNILCVPHSANIEIKNLIEATLENAASPPF